MSWRLIKQVDDIEFNDKFLVVSDADQSLADNEWPKIKALGGWNGEVLFGKILDNKLIARPGQYLWTQVPIYPENFSPLGVVGFIYKNNELLWVQRGPNVVNPGLWSFSAAGHWDSNNQAEVIMAKEANEELGFNLQTGQVSSWQKVSLMQFDDRIKTPFLIQVLIAKAHDNWKPTLEPKEAIDYVWQKEPDLSWWKAHPESLDFWQVISPKIKEAIANG